ncbi:MAG: nuclear transport factor 2 family protein [Sphingomonas sp.]|nr:nuclear transport factor 2 family protein [Sphingomonas sp.]
MGLAGALAAAHAQPIAPDATLQARTRRQLQDYLKLRIQGNPNFVRYHAHDIVDETAEQLWADTRWQLRSQLLDDDGRHWAAELQSVEPAPVRSAIMVFGRMQEGRIDSIVRAPEAARFIPGRQETLPRRPRPTGAPLPATVSLDRMTAEKFRDYLDLFGRFDERFVRYYTPDVIFAAMPARMPIRGRRGILGLYRGLRKELAEHLTVRRLVIDSESGLMAAALTNRLTAYGEVKLPSRVLAAGDQLELSGALVYGLRHGRISLIRDLGQ